MTRALLVVSALSAACASGSVVELRDALPRQPELSMALRTAPPQALTSCPSTGPSTYGALTHEVSGTVDGVLGDVLDLVEDLAAQPADAQGAGQAMWGPFAGVSSEFMLAIKQTDATGFEFFLGGEPLGATEAWQGMFGGTATVVDPWHRSGEVQVNFTAMHALGMTADPVEGGAAVQYVIDDAGRHVTAHFGGVVGANDPLPADAAYELVEAPDHTTGFAFTRTLDFNGDGTANEVVHIESTWAADGRGVAHVIVTGGSLDQREVRATECWDAAMGVVFAQDGETGVSVGSASCCPG